MGAFVGIDLGTTNSLCAVFVDGQPRLLRNSLGQVLTPSAVGVLPDRQIVVGAPALDLAITHPDRVSTCFKRWMGTDRTVTLGGMQFTAQQLSSLVLRSLRIDAEQALGQPVTDAVITVPAYFHDLQRHATRQAGELAGLVVRRIVNEPTAAALTYGLVDRGADKRIVVVDLGGGTFDVTAMQVFEGTLEIVATAGESRLGGEDFTDRLVQWALGKVGQNLEVAEMKQPRRLARLRVGAEACKRQLGSADSAVLVMPHEDGTVDDRCPGYTIDVAAWRELAASLLRRLQLPIQSALRDARWAAAQIDEVILAGGATRMPIVQELVTRELPVPARCTVNPDEVVALGAAVQTALIADDASVADVVMTDVCPFTLGVEISKELGGQRREGYFLPVIHRNTTIPVSREEFVATVSANQERIQLRVFQGESRRVEDNLLLGALEVLGIPRGPAGQEIAVRFTYDLNGLIEVEARVEATGAKFHTVLTKNVANLDQKQLELAQQQLQRLKFFPREDYGHQHLLRFAAAAVGRVAPSERAEFEHVVDLYEAALHGGDREQFEGARQYLLAAMAQLGIAYSQPEQDG